MFSLPGGTKMFQFPPLASPLIVVMTALQAAGLSHSETPGSLGICPSPRIIAAYRVLHRLREPRHPPCALIIFSLRSRHSTQTPTGAAGGARPYFQLYLLLYILMVSFYSLACPTCQRSIGAHGTCPRAWVENNGFEPLTPCLQSRCSSQLS